MLRKLYLTFDTEDFISENSILGLHKILEMLHKYDLSGLFFITGHMAEKLSASPNTADLLNDHEIGYHTSSHSVHPALFEFTDTESYEDAFKVSFLRETSHINPLTGFPEGRGGIHALKDLFPRKQIIAFRAPGQCWSPPHSEALASLGINHDFSTNISLHPTRFKGINFYPYPICGQWQGGFLQYLFLTRSLKQNSLVMTIHPSLMVNQFEWDFIYFKTNPKTLSKPLERTPTEIASLYHKFEKLLRYLKNLAKMQVIEVTPAMMKLENVLCPTKNDAERCYKHSIRWATRHEYAPKFLLNHFIRFFSSG